MPAEFIDIVKMQELEIGHSKKVLFTSDHFHTWVHGDYPGTKGPMHKHTAHQQFYCVQGQCTFHFPDGTARARNRLPIPDSAPKTKRSAMVILPKEISTRSRRPRTRRREPGPNVNQSSTPCVD
ncbi:MAG: hypothetical protein ACREQ2_01405 [Candidatus Binatia bacterium]